MRQAGRYLPEYKATRARAGSFMGLATNPQYATEVTLQPLERYALDAAILFSDILTVPDAMGLGLSFERGRRPALRAPAARRGGGGRGWPCPTWTSCAMCSTRCASIRKALDGRVPLIGFSGSPWTLACYMVEGGGSDDYRLVKTLMYARPDLMHRILDINAQAVAAYLNAQIDAGAQAVMVFDTWGGVLADGAFQRFSLHYTRRVVKALKREHDGQRVPVHRLHQGRRALAASRSPASAPTWSGWTGRSTWARRAPASATASRCRATSTRTCCSRRPRWCAQRGHRHARQLRPAATCRWPLGRPRLQPRPRHQPAHAARACGGAGRGGARHSRRQRAARLGAAACRAAALRSGRCRRRPIAPHARLDCRRMPVSERSGVDLSPKIMLQRNGCKAQLSDHPDLP